MPTAYIMNSSAKAAQRLIQGLVIMVVWVVASRPCANDTPQTVHRQQEMLQAAVHEIARMELMIMNQNTSA